MTGSGDFGPPMARLVMWRRAAAGPIDALLGGAGVGLVPAYTPGIGPDGRALTPLVDSPTDHELTVAAAVAWCREAWGRGEHGWGIGELGPWDHAGLMLARGWTPAATVWRLRWTEWADVWLPEEERVDWDPTRPWVQELGEAPVAFRVHGTRLHARRAGGAAAGGRYDYRWDPGRGEWEDLVDGGLLGP